MVVEGAPQYGGTLTIHHLSSGVADPLRDPDDSLPYWSNGEWLLPVREQLFSGDIEKYGPRGTNAHNFKLYGTTPSKFLGGNLVESWEVLADSIVLNLEQGIMWQGLNSGVRIMKDRELTAADVVADILYFADSPAGITQREWMGDVYTTDKYTLVIEFTDAELALLSWNTGYGAFATSMISPPETEGSHLWEEMIGTGPFMYEEIEPGSFVSYLPNPLFRGTTDSDHFTAVNGVDYPWPFIDRLVIPIIPDESTWMASLRTGQLDWRCNTIPTQWGPLQKQAPDLIFSYWTLGGGHMGRFRTDQPPFDNKNIRRALMIGTNRDVFFSVDMTDDMNHFWFPIHPDSEYYTPLEELPESIQILYDYNPDLAIEMLEDEGYPFGTLKMEATTINYNPQSMDRMALLVSEWEKIGVEVTLRGLEDSVYVAKLKEGDWKDIIYLSESGNVDAQQQMWRFGPYDVPGSYQYYWENDEYLAIAEVMRFETDEAEIARMILELEIIMLDEAVYLPTGGPRAIAIAYWPCMKNYYGDLSSGFNRNYYDAIGRVFIDLELKNEMGY